MNMLNKNDLINLINFALDEYGAPGKTNIELVKNGITTIEFGTLSAEITMEKIKKNQLYIRQYNVKNKDVITLSFILGISAMLFTESAKEFRNNLISNKKIKGVITLKNSVFKWTTIPAAIIVLGENITDTWFTAIDSIDELINVLNNEFSNVKKIYHSKSLSASNLTPEYYNGDDKIIEERLSGAQTKTLGEIAEIIAGRSVKNELFSDSGIPYIRGRDLQNGRIQKPERHINSNDASKYSKCLLQEGDILLTKNFGQNKLAFVSEDDLPAIASNGLIIIRAYDIPEKYLYDYFTSKTGNEIFNMQLSRITKGATIPNIAPRDLKELIVPIFDSDTIQEIENETNLTKEKVISISKQLFNNIKSENILSTSVFNDLVNAGWTAENLIREKIVTIDSKQIIPDLYYTLNDGRSVFFEIKFDLSSIDTKWITKMNTLLNEKNNLFLIITTGVYYEVHRTSLDDSLKTLKAPTIEEILNWEKEVL